MQPARISLTLSRHLSPFVHRFWQVLRATPHILTELLYVGTKWSPCFRLAMWRGPQEYITYEIIGDLYIYIYIYIFIIRVRRSMDSLDSSLLSIASSKRHSVSQHCRWMCVFVGRPVDIFIPLYKNSLENVAQYILSSAQLSLFVLVGSLARCKISRLTIIIFFWAAASRICKR